MPHFNDVVHQPTRKSSQRGGFNEGEEINSATSVDSDSKMCKEDSTTSSKSKKELMIASLEVDQDRYRDYVRLLHKCCLVKNQAQSLDINVIRSYFAIEKTMNPFNDDEIDACIDKMVFENKVMRSDDTVFIL